MTDFLTHIINSKATHLVAQKKCYSQHNIDADIAAQEAFFIKRPFAKTLQERITQHHPAVIAECKKASPSKGVIREEYNPTAIAHSYQQHGAHCLSVLTDKEFFQGAAAHLIAIRQAISLPLLRKDFIIDEYQIAESRLIGADCILLILSALDDARAADLYQTAHAYNLDVLVETHTIAEVERALKLAPTLLGVNNRNLHTFEVSLETTHLAKQIVPDGTYLITESGISSREAVADMMEHNIYGFLIGEHCMRSPSPGEALADLFDNKLVKT